MMIGVPKEIKTHEYRVGLVPASVAEIVRAGALVVVEHHAGLGIGICDAAYIDAGALIVDTAEEVFARADLIVKVKEPQPNECKMLKEGQVLFTFLHLAADPLQAQLLMNSGATAIAYETVTDAFHHLPLLAPMSQVAGRMSIQAGAHALEVTQGGSGVLLGGVPGVLPGHVMVIGGGVVGSHAIAMAMGLGARVTVLDQSLKRLNELDALYGGRLETLFATQDALANCINSADLVVGAVLIPGAAAPKLVTRAMLQTMRPGSVVVDVAIDQGGCMETSRPTTHEAPIFVEEGVVHYCVTNMPGAVARTSTFALNHATLPYVMRMVRLGVSKALEEDPGFRMGVNVFGGRVVHEVVARALG